MRQVQFRTNQPMDAAGLAKLHEIFAAEGGLLNKVYKTMLEHDIRSGNDDESDGLGRFPAAEQAAMFEAMKKSV